MPLDIDSLSKEIVERLKPLNPKKILLFGSYAYGTPTNESDIDLFIIKELPKEEVRNFKVEAKLKLRELIKKYKIGFDIIVASQKLIESRKDYFYDVEIKQKAKVLYE